MGGGSGGGGSAGKIEYPAHVTAAHADWLDDDGTDSIESSMTELMNAAIGASPFIGAVAFDPATYITAALAGPTALAALVAQMTALDTVIADFLSDTKVAAEIDAFSDQLDAQLESTVYPRFEVGMRDVNAVMSSAFVLGRALIEDGRDREVARFASQVRLQRSGPETIQMMNMRVQSQVQLAQALVEANRIAIVAKKEQTDRNLYIDEADAKWDLSVFTYGGNLMAAPGGGTVMPQRASDAATALGGAMSGAAMGAMAGSVIPGVGTVAGAVAGGVLGIAAGLL